mgnify:CR=1 FL=1
MKDFAIALMVAPILFGGIILMSGVVTKLNEKYGERKVGIGVMVLMFLIGLILFFL